MKLASSRGNDDSLGNICMKTLRFVFAALAISSVTAGPSYTDASNLGAPLNPDGHDSAINLQTYDAACRIVTERFFDPAFRGVDWPALCAANRQGVEDMSDAELADQLNAMLVQLDTSHTAVYTPDDQNFYLLFDIFAQSPNLQDQARALFEGGRVVIDGIGVFTRRIDGRTFIEDVLETTPAAEVGLQVGDEIIAVDGASFEPIGSFAGKAGKIVDITIRRQADGPYLDHEVSVRRFNPTEMFVNAMEASARIVEHHGHRIGYVRIWSSAGEIYHDTLEGLLQHGLLADADALVIDLRGRIGGGGPSYLEIVDPRGPELTVTGRGFAQVSPMNFRDRTVWLIDAGVRSAGELLTYTIQRDGYGPLVGETTAGAVVGGSPFLLPNGSLLYLAVIDLAVDGARLEGVGIAPDVVVPFTLPYAGGADPQLERAMEEAALLASATVTKQGVRHRC